jgi:hypothetical protein
MAGFIRNQVADIIRNARPNSSESATRRLTPAHINTAKAEVGADRTIFWDTDVRGLGLMVTTAGAKSYVFQFRVGKGRKARIRRMTSETVDQITFTQARQQADEARQLARKGLDPWRSGTRSRTRRAHLRRWLMRT